MSNVCALVDGFPAALVHALARSSNSRVVARCGHVSAFLTTERSFQAPAMAQSRDILSGTTRFELRNGDRIHFKVPHKPLAASQNVLGIGAFSFHDVNLTCPQCRRI